MTLITAANTESKIDKLAEYNNLSNIDISQEVQKQNLFYDKNTLIVYTIYYEADEYFFMLPYYGSNGLPCKYINGQVVEIYQKEAKDVLSSSLEVTSK